MKTRITLEIDWIKPKFKEEVGEYLENKYTSNFFKRKYNLVLENEKACILFLEHGNFKTMDRAALSRALCENITLTKKDFESELKDNTYKKSYNTMYESLIKDGKITLQSPILIKFPSLYYGFAGNRRTNLAFNLNMPVCFWVVDYKAYLRTIPTKKEV